MKTNHLSKIYLTPIALLVLITTPLWAAGQQSVDQDFATIQPYGSSVYWSIDPRVNFDSITLTLTTTDGSRSVTVTDREPSTGALADGGYKYELVVTPALDPSVRAELKAAREAAGGQEAYAAVKALKSQGKIPKHRQVQSGFFRILNGQVVSADEAQE